MKSFRDSSDWGRKTLDRLVFTHRLETCVDCTEVIRFIDAIEHRGRHLHHECRMHVTLNETGHIQSLRLEDLPGEKDKVAEFFAAVGVSRSAG